MGKRLSVQDSAERQRLLASQSTSELAASRGLQVPPTTAVGTRALGGTPQQQAMAGTPAQKQSAIASATKVAAPTGETALEQAKTLRGPAVASVEDEAKKRKAAGFATALGTTGDKVSEFISGALAKIPTITAKAEVADTNSIIANITVADTKNAVTAALAALADGALTPAARLAKEAELATLLKSTPDTILTPDQKTALYQSATATTAAAAGKAVAEVKGAEGKLTVSDITTLGTSMEELSSLTGLSAEEIGNMSIADLQNTLATVGQQDFGETQAVTSGMASGLLSSTERAALRDTLRSLEETGIAGAESQYTSLLKDIDEGATVTVGGQSYSIEEILNEETMAGILTDYFNDPNSKQSQLLAAEEPELVKWANTNSTGIKELINKSASASGELKDIQTQTKAAFGTLATLQPGLLNELTGIDLSKIRTSVPVKDDTGQWMVDGKVLPLSVQAVMNAPVNKQAQMSTSLASLAEVVDTKELQEYSTADIEKLQLDKINGLWSTYSDAITEANKSQNLTDPEGQLDAVAQGYDISDINEAVSDAALYASLGLPTGNLKTFDSNDDGKFDSTDVATLYKGVSTTKPTLDSVANGTYRPPAKLTVQAPKLSTSQQVLADSVKDGVLSPDEIEKVSSSLSADEMNAAINSLLNSNSPLKTNAVLNPLRTALRAKTLSDANNALGKDSQEVRNTIDAFSFITDTGFTDDRMQVAQARASNTEGKIATAINELNQALTKAPSAASKQLLQNYKDTLQEQLDILRQAFARFIAQDQQARQGNERQTAYNPPEVLEPF